MKRGNSFPTSQLLHIVGWSLEKQLWHPSLPLPHSSEEKQWFNRLQKLGKTTGQICLRPFRCFTWTCCRQDLAFLWFLKLQTDIGQPLPSRGLQVTVLASVSRASLSIRGIAVVLSHGPKLPFIMQCAFVSHEADTLGSSLWCILHFSLAFACEQRRGDLLIASPEVIAVKTQVTLWTCFTHRLSANL